MDEKHLAANMKHAASSEPVIKGRTCCARRSSVKLEVLLEARAGLGAPYLTRHLAALQSDRAVRLTSDSRDERRPVRCGMPLNPSRLQPQSTNIKMSEGQHFLVAAHAVGACKAQVRLLTLLTVSINYRQIVHQNMTDPLQR